MTQVPPHDGELIYGCFHATACGTVAEVVAPVVAGDACGQCASIREAWHGRQVRVRREANGNLYEVRTDEFP